jgi:hypothetical protein
MKITDSSFSTFIVENASEFSSLFLSCSSDDLNELDAERTAEGCNSQRANELLADLRAEGLEITLLPFRK